MRVKNTIIAFEGGANFTPVICTVDGKKFDACLHFSPNMEVNQVKHVAVLFRRGL